MKKNILVLITVVLLIAGTAFARAIVEFDHSYVDFDASVIKDSYKGNLPNMSFMAADAVAQRIITHTGSAYYLDDVNSTDTLVYKGNGSNVKLSIDRVTGDIFFHKGMEIYNGNTPNLPTKAQAPALAKKHLKALGLLKNGMVLNEVNVFKQASFDGKTNEIQEKMVLVTFKRKLGGLTVFGASRVIVMLGANGELDGVIVRWADTEKVKVSGIKKNLRNYLTEKIAAKQKDSYSVLVKKSQLVLFDDGKGVIEPAVFVEGEVTENGMNFTCDWMVPVVESPKAIY